MTSAHAKFIEDIAAYVAKYAPQYEIRCYSAVIAQAILESRWGESRLARDYHNYFGLKCGSKWTGASVNMRTMEEYAPGTLTAIQDDFRAYSSMEKGIIGYFEFIQLKRYHNLRGITDPWDYLWTIKADGYATSVYYAENVMKVVTACDLQIYDEEEKMNFDPNKVIDIAKAEVGYLEKRNGDLSYLYDKTANAGSSNYTKYGYEMHKIYPEVMDYPASWCDAFVDHCFMTAYGVANARSLLGGNYDDYTVASAQLYKNKGAWHGPQETPQKGDQIFFKNSKRICHTGLVVDVIPSSGTIVTVEGNTSNDTSKVVANGGAVCQKYYKIGQSSIAGYGRPPYGMEKEIAFTPHWARDGDKWYYRVRRGKNARGWLQINHHWYYFAPDGLMLTGLQNIDGKLYFLMTDGELEGACCQTDVALALTPCYIE